MASRFDGDYLATGNFPRQLNAFEMGELDPSICTDLDTVGMQPHSREYLERQMLGIRSDRRFMSIDGQVIDHPAGIQFSGTP